MNLKSRLWFLRCCVCLGVVPVTLTVNIQHQPGFTGEQEIKWKETQTKSEEKFLTLAKEQIEREGCDYRTKLRREILDLQDTIEDEVLWRQLESSLEKARVRAWKSSNNVHRLKLKHLLVKSEKEIPYWLNKSAQTKTEFSNLFLSNETESSSQSGLSERPIHSTPIRSQTRVQFRPTILLPERPPVPPPGVRHNVDQCR